ncbi:MAG TPA: DUF456 domain-containing protein [Acidimicrobiia bacterium]|nr:DUF456 domain-containing protein [Acidimicrobiia bacterium]
MDPFGEVVIGLLILVGLAGILLPVLPGLLLITGSIVVWAWVEGGAAAWTVAIIGLLLAVVGSVVKYLVPGRRLRDAGVPRSTLWLAGGLAILGFFVIPVLGAPLGFVGGTYLAERQRLGPERAWLSTKASLGAVGLSIGIELFAGLLIAGLWLGAIIFWT